MGFREGNLSQVHDSYLKDNLKPHLTYLRILTQGIPSNNLIKTISKTEFYLIFRITFLALLTVHTKIGNTRTESGTKKDSKRQVSPVHFLP